MLQTLKHQINLLLLSSKTNNNKFKRQIKMRKHKELNVSKSRRVNTVQILNINHFFVFFSKSTLYRATRACFQCTPGRAKTKYLSMKSSMSWTSVNLCKMALSSSSLHIIFKCNHLIVLSKFTVLLLGISKRLTFYPLLLADRKQPKLFLQQCNQLSMRWKNILSNLWVSIFNGSQLS